MLGTHLLRKASKKASKQQKMLDRAMLETLESRTLMSAATSYSTAIRVASQAPGPATSTNSGFIPSQITSAYGFTKASFDNGTVAANGAGQTIAIVDASGDPNIQSDLTTFDEAYGIPAPPSFTEISQRGTTDDVPTQDPEGWDTEISLDVEWAHATAPGANILLVVTDDQTVPDFMAGIQAAEAVPGVSVITMSFGIPIGEDGLTAANELSFDSSFTTPPGHQGITFLASIGDSGAVSGIKWPAESPNVVSVGGTSLSIDQYGDYEGESTWGNAPLDPPNGSEPNISSNELEPSYQQPVQQTGFRETADVSYNADPQTGFAIFDSLPVEDGNEGEPGWTDIGGTSASSPSWAGLMAIADQGRALGGLDTLDGPSQTLPLLYSVYSAPGTAGYAKYTSYFNDVEIGGSINSAFANGGVGYGLTASAAGWDPVTGLGTPKVPAIVSLLDTPPAPMPASTAGNGAAAGSVVFSGNAALSPSPFLARLTTALPSGVIAGQAGSIRLSLTDSSATAFRGPVTVTLDATTNGTTDQQIQTYSFPLISLKPKRSATELLKFTYPSTLDGTYYLVGFVSTSEAETGVASAVSSNSTFIGPATVDLATSFANNTAVKITPGASNSAYITITNDGNVTASGLLTLSLYASADAVLNSSDTLLTTVSNKAIRLAPRKSIRIRVVFQSPDNLLGGSFDLISSISSTTTPADTNSANDTAFVGTTAS
jgi:subtilase family serine protease